MSAVGCYALIRTGATRHSSLRRLGSPHSVRPASPERRSPASTTFSIDPDRNMPPARSIRIYASKVCLPAHATCWLRILRTWTH